MSGAGSCGGGQCGCAGAANAGQGQAQGQALVTLASINGVALHPPGLSLTDDALRERAWGELLRQEAMRRGFLPQRNVLESPELSADDHERIGLMIDSQLPVPEPTEDEARRYYEGHTTRFVAGARARVRHILFAVTEGVDVSLLAARAEKALVELSAKDVAPGRFGELARELSNCPSGAEGGELGWLSAHELAPELANELFHQSGGAQPMGLRPRLVHSRYGFHVLEVQEREPGRQAPFEQVRERIAAMLTQQSRARALHQYIRVLAGQARIEGVELEAADSPLVQ